MKRSLLLFLTLTALSIFVWIGFIVTRSGWRTGSIAGFEVRRHALSGKIQVLTNGVWSQSWQDDPAMMPLDAKDMRRTKLANITRGENGLLVGTAKLVGGQTLRGRFALQLRVIEPSGTRVRDRSLRLSADWDNAGSIPWVLDTQIPTPELRQKTTIRLELIR